MVEKFYPTRHVTLGSVIDAGLRIHAYCMKCKHGAELDLNAMARKLGRDYGSLPAHLVPKLVCSECGGKDIMTVLAPAETEIPEDHAEHVMAEWKRGEPRREGN